MKIAITGSIGSGKTTVCDYIRSKGFYVFDCDKCNAELLNEDNIGYLEVKKAFPEVFDNNLLNKRKLSNLAFNDVNNKNKLESIMHPLILNALLEDSIKYNAFFAEVPLLFEVNWDKYFDVNILVTCDEDIAIKRLINRGLSVVEAKERLNNQLKIEDKLKRSDEIIYNNGDLSALFIQVDKLLLKYVR